MSKTSGFKSEAVAEFLLESMAGCVRLLIQSGIDVTNMPSRPSLVRLGSLFFLMSAVSALSASPEKPEAFVRRVYARYGNDGPGMEMVRPSGTPFYTAVLLDAFAQDVAGGEGTIDWDPVCNCQTWNNLRIKSVVMTGEQADKVKAQVFFINLGSSHTVTLTLSRTPAGWRIADIGEKGAKSIMALLRSANAHPSQPVQPSGAEASQPKP